MQLALIACYIPFIICAIVMKIKDLSGTTANTIYIQSDLRKLFIEPNSLLLADQRRETRSEGHDQTVLLPLKLS